MMEKAKLNRRALLSATAIVGSTLALSGLGARAETIKGKVPWAPGEADFPSEVQPGPLQYFTEAESNFVDAAVSRLIPIDEHGPGAKELGVTFFLDRQLSGPYGRAERWYMSGPWPKGGETQGYQSRLTPAQLYRAGIREVDAYCRQNYGQKAFAQLGAEDQDKVLGELEEGKATLDGVDAKTFFKQLLLNTQEGFLSDPLYGGNKDMAAWKMIGFPGARYDYRDYVAKHGQRFPLPPVSLKGRPAWDTERG